MKNLTQSFNKLLEQYLSNAATKFIELADHKGQTGLINLMLSVDTVSSSVNNKKLFRSIQPLATEWQQVLDKPVSFQPVHNKWLIGATYHRLSKQEAYIAQIELAIEFTQQQCQLIKTNFPIEPVRSKLLHRNNTILDQYQQHLKAAQTTYQAVMNRLSQLSGK